MQEGRTTGRGTAYFRSQAERLSSPTPRRARSRTARCSFGEDKAPRVGEPDLTELHAQIDQLSLENDFLNRALTKAHC
jgi:hypothetical protein